MTWLWAALAPAAAALGLAGGAALHARRAVRALPPEGRFVEVAGCRLHYVERGRGPPLVMVHGLGGSLHHFAHGLVDGLAAHHRLILVDRPGSGHSTRPRGWRGSPRAQGEVIAAFIERLDLDRPLLVGHSLGGAIALAVGLDRPGAVAGLALIAPLTEAPREVPPHFRGLAIRSVRRRRLVAWTLAVPATMLGGAEALRVAFSPQAPPRDWPLRGGGLLGARPSAFEAASADLMAVEDDLAGMAARYAELSVPVAILHGADDAILEARASAGGAIAAAPRLDVRIVEGAGHMILVTHPGETAAWLREVAARGAASPRGGR